MASVVVTMDAREAALFRAMDKMIQKQNQTNQKFKDGGKASEEAGKKSKSALDQAGLSMDKLKAGATSYVAGLAGVAAAVGLVQKAWEQVRKEQEAGLNQLKKTQGQDMRLLQISNEQEFIDRRALADSLAAQFGIDRAVVREVIFSAVSENFEDAVPAIMAASQVVDPMAAAGVAGQAPALFKGMISALEAVDLTLKAAQASRLDFSQIAAALPGAAQGAAVAGTSVDETLAVLAVLANEFKSGEEAATMIKTFATKVGITEGMGSIGMVAAVEKLQAMDEAGRKEFLGTSDTLNVAFIKLADNLKMIKQRVDEFGQERAAFAAGKGLLATQSDIAARDPKSIALLNEARALQGLEAAQANVSGIAGASSATAQSMVTEQLLGSGLLSRLIGTVVGPISSLLGAEFGFSASDSASAGVAYSQGIAGLASPTSANPMGMIDKLMQAAVGLNMAAETLDAAAARMGSTVGPARAQANSAPGAAL